MLEKEYNFECKYSGCHDGKDNKKKQYYVCLTCLQRKPWKEQGCCFEHYEGYQNEIAISRNEPVPYPDYIEQMIMDGVITDDMLDDILVD